MQINKIENYNNKTNFKAKLDIGGETFFGEVYQKMMDKAAQIGTEKDIIDIKYVGYYAGKSKNSAVNDRFKGTFVGKFIQKGNKTNQEKVRQEINDTTRYAYREKAKAAAVKYVDDLFNKYAK